MLTSMTFVFDPDASKAGSVASNPNLCQCLEFTDKTAIPPFDNILFISNSTAGPTCPWVKVPELIIPL